MIATETVLRVAPLAALWMILDVNYFLRGVWAVFVSRLTRSRNPPGPFVPTTTWAICLPMDLDFMLHMNNSRYLRECDFARFQFWNESHLYAALKRLGCHFTNRGNNIRYRRSIELFDIFKIRTQLVFWDEKNFYLEQQMIRRSDSFICAINYTSQPVLGKDKSKQVTPQQVLESMYGELEVPEAPPDIQAWIKSTELSSQALYKNAEL